MKRILSLLLALVMISAALSAAAVNAVADETETANAYASIYTGESDTSWYYDDPEAEDFHITSANQLAGFSELVGRELITFKNKTVYLDCDIVWNEGEFTVDENGGPLFNGEPAIANETAYLFEPIGSRAVRTSNSGNAAHTSVEKLAGQFAGTFDGQGHTVSGLFADYRDTQQYVGFFSVFCGRALKNLNIVNSYFSGDSRCGIFAGFAVVPKGIGDNNEIGTVFENLYTDAALVVCTPDDNNARSGGILGMIRPVQDHIYEDDDNPSTNGFRVVLDKCWFDGIIWSLHALNYNGGLVGLAALDDNTGNRNGTNENNRRNTIEIENCLVTGVINNVPEPRSPWPDSYICAGLVMGGLFRGYCEMENVIVSLRDTNIREENGFLPEERDVLGDDGVTVIGKETATGKGIVGYYESLPCEITYNNVFYSPTGMFKENRPLQFVEASQGSADSQKTIGAPESDADLTRAYVKLLNSGAFAFTLSSDGALTVSLSGIDATLDPIDSESFEYDADTDPVTPDTEPKPADTTTAEPVNTTAKPADTTAAKEEKGCGGFTAVGAILALVAVTGAAIVIKKK